MEISKPRSKPKSACALFGRITRLNVRGNAMTRKYAELRAKMTPAQRAAAVKLTLQLTDELPLHQLRHALVLTQKQLAESLGVTHGAISKMESQSDMLISTLQRIIEAMGGELELKVRFPQGGRNPQGPRSRSDLTLLIVITSPACASANSIAPTTRSSDRSRAQRVSSAFGASTTSGQDRSANL